MNLHFPNDMAVHVKKVLDGEYSLPMTFNPSIIIDIGANVGAFTVWAKLTWPKAKVIAYEPVPSTFQLLIKNVSRIPNVDIHNVAVTTKDNTVMHLGKHNIGEASFYDTGGISDKTVQVETVKPDTLPLCSYLKLDTEGSELDILPEYLAKVGHPSVIAFEFHSEQDRLALDELLIPDYSLLCGEIISPHRGTLKYVKRSALLTEKKEEG